MNNDLINIPFWVHYILVFVLIIILILTKITEKVNDGYIILFFTGIFSFLFVLKELKAERLDIISRLRSEYNIGYQNAYITYKIMQTLEDINLGADKGYLVLPDYKEHDIFLLSHIDKIISKDDTLEATHIVLETYTTFWHKTGVIKIIKERLFFICGSECSLKGVARTKEIENRWKELAKITPDVKKDNIKILEVLKKILKEFGESVDLEENPILQNYFLESKK